jgi:hypothetical protein
MGQVLSIAVCSVADIIPIVKMMVAFFEL